MKLQSSNGKLTQSNFDATKQAKILAIVDKTNITFGLKLISRWRVQHFVAEQEIQRLTPKDIETSAQKLAMEDFLKYELGMTKDKIKKPPYRQSLLPKVWG